MTDPQPAGFRFRLIPQPPVRAMAIAAGVTLVGAVLAVAAAFLHWPTGWLVVGLVLMLLGVGLTAAALILSRSARTLVFLDDASITVIRGRHRATRSWRDVKEVVQQGPRLILSGGEGTDDLVVIRPPGSSDLVFLRLLEAISIRLDRDRGYGGTI